MDRRSVAGMFKLVHAVISAVARRFRSRAVVELENLALRHQLQVLRRQRPGRPRLFALDPVGCGSGSTACDHAVSR